MSDASANFSKLVPGFDFMQTLVKNAGAALPPIGAWVAPTLDPEEIEKRIEELRTVQFWLEQNARMIGATIQALEVQRMTLSTLKTMNVQMGDLRDSMMIRMPEAAPAPARRPEPEPEPEAELEDELEDAEHAEDAEDDVAEDDEPAAAVTASARSAAGSAAARTAATPAAAAPAPGLVDPMLWWGSLTKQFTELAANAMKDAGAGQAAAALAQAMVPTTKAGATAPKTAAAPRTATAKTPARAAGKTTRKPAARKRSKP
jgi:hypothetical protein